VIFGAPRAAPNRALAVTAPHLVPLLDDDQPSATLITAGAPPLAPANAASLRASLDALAGRDAAGALTQLEVLPQAQRNAPWYAFALGVANTQTGAYDDASKALHAAAAALPDDPVIRYRLGLAYDLADRHAAAAAEYQAAVERNPRFAVAWCNLGITRSRLGRYEEAIAAFKQAIAVDRRYANAHYCLGLAYWNTGQPDEARASWRRAVQLDPDSEAGQSAATLLRNPPQ
jgi:tetratricopeptide (TPR) repeat protein